MCMYGCIYVHIGAGVMDIRSHGDAGYEPPDVGAWNPLSNCGKAVCALNH